MLASLLAKAPSTPTTIPPIPASVISATPQDKLPRVIKNNPSKLLVLCELLKPPNFPAVISRNGILLAKCKYVTCVNLRDERHPMIVRKLADGRQIIYVRNKPELAYRMCLALVVLGMLSLNL